jgi:hypothetical protein
LELVILTLGRGRAPLRGPRPVKPPALPEDTYLRLRIESIYVNRKSIIRASFMIVMV